MSDFNSVVATLIYTPLTIKEPFTGTIARMCVQLGKDVLYDPQINPKIMNELNLAASSIADVWEDTLKELYNIETNKDRLTALASMLDELNQAKDELVYLIKEPVLSVLIPVITNNAWAISAGVDNALLEIGINIRNRLLLGDKHKYIKILFDIHSMDSSKVQFSISVYVANKVTTDLNTESIVFVKIPSILLLSIKKTTKEQPINIH